MKFKKYMPWHTLFLLVILAFGLQSCLGISDNNLFQNKTTGKHGQVGINTTTQAKFEGKLYLTLDRNLYVLDGKNNLTQLTHGMDVRDPAVSPDGKWIAFIVSSEDYSDLDYLATNTNDPTLHTVVTGNGQFYKDQNGANNYYWFAQPAWSADSSKLLFLSDLHKHYYWASLGAPFSNAYFLDMQIFSLPIGATKLTASQALNTATPIAYANFGDGGDRDPTYRPNHPEQVMYTHYSYDQTQTKQVVQIFIEDATLMAKAYSGYHPGVQAGSQNDPSMALTPATADLVNLQPTFSPDGNTILYVRREDATHMSLYTMPVADGVTNDPNNSSFNLNAPANVQKALAPYAQSVKLLTKQYLSQPVWSPDGQQIAYYDYNNNIFDLWLATVIKDSKTGVVSIRANSIVQLTNTQGDLDGDSRPCWAA